METSAAPVTADQFRDDGDLAVIHVPTGQRYYTWRYARIGDMSEVIVEYGRNEIGPDGRRYDGAAIADLAFGLLRDKLAKVIGA